MDARVFRHLWRALDAGLALQAVEQRYQASTPAANHAAPVDDWLAERSTIVQLRACYEEQLHALRFYDQGWASKLEQTLLQLRQLSVGDHDQWLRRQIRVVAPFDRTAARALALRLLLAAWRAEVLEALGDEEAAAVARAEAAAAAQAVRCRRTASRWAVRGVDGTAARRQRDARDAGGDGRRRSRQNAA